MSITWKLNVSLWIINTPADSNENYLVYISWNIIALYVLLTFAIYLFIFYVIKFGEKPTRNFRPINSLLDVLLTSCRWCDEVSVKSDDKEIFRVLPTHIHTDNQLAPMCCHRRFIPLSLFPSVYIYTKNRCDTERKLATLSVFIRMYAPLGVGVYECVREPFLCWWCMIIYTFLFLHYWIANMENMKIAHKWATIQFGSKSSSAIAADVFCSCTKIVAVEILCRCVCCILVTLQIIYCSVDDCHLLSQVHTINWLQSFNESMGLFFKFWFHLFNSICLKSFFFSSTFHSLFQ